jgi:hypothetical protein
MSLAFPLWNCQPATGRVPCHHVRTHELGWGKNVYALPTLKIAWKFRGKKFNSRFLDAAGRLCTKPRLIHYVINWDLSLLNLCLSKIYFYLGRPDDQFLVIVSWGEIAPVAGEGNNWKIWSCPVSSRVRFSRSKGYQITMLPFSNPLDTKKWKKSELSLMV